MRPRSLPPKRSVSAHCGAHPFDASKRYGGHEEGRSDFACTGRRQDQHPAILQGPVERPFAKPDARQTRFEHRTRNRDYATFIKGDTMKIIGILIVTLALATGATGQLIYDSIRIPVSSGTLCPTNWTLQTETIVVEARFYMRELLPSRLRIVCRSLSFRSIALFLYVEATTTGNDGRARPSRFHCARPGVGQCTPRPER